MIIEIKENISKHLNEYWGLYNEAIDKSLFAFSNSLRNSIVRGKLSGNPVKRRTGNLANSIAVHRTNEKQYEVGSYGVRYAKRLEYGYDGRYRWLKTGYIDSKEEALQQFKLVFKSALRGRL